MNIDTGFVNGNGLGLGRGRGVLCSRPKQVSGFGFHE